MVEGGRRMRVELALVRDFEFFDGHGARLQNVDGLQWPASSSSPPMVGILLYSPKGNSARIFPHRGFLGLSPVVVEGRESVPCTDQRR